MRTSNRSPMCCTLIEASGARYCVVMVSGAMWTSNEAADVLTESYCETDGTGAADMKSLV